MSNSITSKVATAMLMVVFLLHTCLVEAQTELPSCYSSTDEYIFKEFIVPVQPQEPVLVQRFEGPEIKIFCTTFEEAGPTCGDDSIPVLCSRKKNDISAAFKCETLEDYANDPNAKVTRGNINGDNMIWLLKWDGTSKSPQCFPRSVKTRVLAFVRGKEVASVAVFVILLLIALGAVGLMIAGAFLFIRERYYKIDEAGATTIGGPKQSFQGPQLAVAEGGVVKDQTKVYLPVRQDNGALSDMTASKFGNLSTQQVSRSATKIELNNRGPGRRASPPAPFDGVEDEGLREGIRRQQRSGRGGRGRNDYDDDQFGDSDYFSDGYSSGGPSRNEGRHQRPFRHPRKDDGPRPLQDEKTPRKGSLFPTQSNWESQADLREDGNYFDDEFGNLDSNMRTGDSAMMPNSFGGPAVQQTVKYIPQWMHGSFGKGGTIPEVGDGAEETYEGYGSGNEYEVGNRSMHNRAPGSSGAKTFGRYNKKKDDPNKENSVFGPTPRKGPNGSQVGNTPRSALKKRNVGSARKSDAQDDDGYWSNGGDGPFGGPNGRGNSRNVNFATPGRNGNSPNGDFRGGPAAFNARKLREEQNETSDMFHRDRARIRTANPNMSLNPNDSFNRSGMQPAEDGVVNSPTQIMRCAHCKVPLGTPDTPVHCRVTGELHH